MRGKRTGTEMEMYELATPFASPTTRIKTKNYCVGQRDFAYMHTRMICNFISDDLTRNHHHDIAIHFCLLLVGVIRCCWYASERFIYLK